MDSESTTFADALRQARKAAGLTQRQVAQQVGVTDGYVPQLEKGTRRPNNRLRAQLVALLGIDPNLPDSPGANIDWGFGPVTLQPRMQIEWWDPTGEFVVEHLTGRNRT